MHVAEVPNERVRAWLTEVADMLEGLERNTSNLLQRAEGDAAKEWLTDQLMAQVLYGQAARAHAAGRFGRADELADRARYYGKREPTGLPRHARPSGPAE